MSHSTNIYMIVFFKHPN